jgi:hypothetical protein
VQAKPPDALFQPLNQTAAWFCFPTSVTNRPTGSEVLATVDQTVGEVSEDSPQIIGFATAVIMFWLYHVLAQTLPTISFPAQIFKGGKSAWSL